MAESIKLISDKANKVLVASKACELFKKENPRFNKKKFLAACGL